MRTLRRAYVEAAARVAILSGPGRGRARAPRGDPVNLKFKGLAGIRKLAQQFDWKSPLEA
jgi:hypothetical protein